MTSQSLSTPFLRFLSLPPARPAKEALSVY